MEPLDIFVLVGYLVSLVITLLCLPDINHWEIGRKILPTLLAISVYTNIINLVVFLALFLPQCSVEEGDGQCYIALTVLAYLMDWFTSTATDLVYIYRMKAMLLKEEERSRIRWFMIISYGYGIAGITSILSVWEVISENDAAVIWSVCNILLVFNQLVMHAGLIRVLTTGNLSKCAQGHESKRKWLAIGLTVATVLYLAGSIYYMVDPELGMPMVNIPWAFNLKMFGLVNRFIEELMLRRGVINTARVMDETTAAAGVCGR